MFPLAVMGRGGWDLSNWVQEYERFWRERAAAFVQSGDDSGAAVAHQHETNAQAFGLYLKDLTEQYQVAYIELDRDLPLDKVCDIFTQVNSKGVRLDVFDLINAMLKPKGLQLKLMWREAAPRLSFVDTEKMNVYVLQVMSILRQSYCSPKYLYYLLPEQEKSVREAGGSLRKEVLVKDTAEFKQHWTQSVEALSKAIDLLRHPQEFGAISSQYLPYVSILPAFAALQVQARELPANRQLDAQRKIRHWYWASIFTNRYSGSVESTTARDFLDVKVWFEKDEAEPALLADFHRRFRALDLRKEVKRGTSVYNGIFNLLVLRGARDWMTGNVPQYGDLDDHHIVPQSWGKEQGLGPGIDTILNRTPLTADTNRKVINDRLPHEYLPELIKASGETTVKATLESHFVSPAALGILLRDPFSPSDYEEFLAERQRTLLDAIENLLIKERLDLPPQLRELDAQIEDVELRLRKTIANVLAAASAELPPHVIQKVDERLQPALRKNPSLDQAYYQTLAGKLEYCDLRELQDTVMNKSLWPLFEPQFGTKVVMEGRFDQFASLRNGIRHSRTVDEITRKDGEAAILWFRQILKS
ncbi:MAG: hypothetical protein NTX53_19625 [candidate division WOR-3 bacterium]|nr:hypothetical protein [candidate division WOR-3 bacterium]